MLPRRKSWNRFWNFIWAELHC